MKQKEKKTIKIAMYDLEGYLLEVFEVETYKDLGDQLKIPAVSIHSCINNKQHQANNRQFKELNSSRVALKKIGDVSSFVNGSSEYRVIVKLYKGVPISSYSTIKEACQKNNINNSSLSLCLKGSTKSCGGFEWRFF